MLRQIALILLCLFVALPAVAAPGCHAQPLQTVSAAPHHDMDHSELHSVGDEPAPGNQPESAMVKQHPCVGCITAIALPELASSFALAHLVPSLAAIDPLEGLAHLPMLPPPRS